MIYLTGDTHGDFARISSFCHRFETTKDDLMIVLGDNGVNYWGGKRDKALKKKLQELPITFMMIRGNHDQRPSKKLYQDEYISGGSRNAQWRGNFLVEPDFPSLLFAKDGWYYHLAGHDALVIGGAYSVDKYYRLEQQEAGHTGYRWFYDEQLTPTERDVILTELSHWVRRKLGPDLILSHTCPYQYVPREMFLGMIDQSTVDDSMEHWLDQINAILHKGSKWYCGHWHTNKKVDHMHFLYEDIIDLKPHDERKYK